MAILSKGTTFSDGDSVTSTKLNNLVDAAVFVAGSSGTTDDATMQVLPDGRLAVKTVQTGNIAAGAVSVTRVADSAITEVKLASGAVTETKIGAGAVVTAKIADDAVTTAKVLNASITPAKLSQPSTLETAQASTSGTSIDFTGIPSWVKRITVGFIDVSTNGSSPVQVQIGDSGGFETTGYTSTAFLYNSGTLTTSTSGFILTQGISASAVLRSFVTLVRISGNTWGESGIILSSSNAPTQSAGLKQLSDTLDRVRITTVNGTDAFDAGSINIMYE